MANYAIPNTVPLVEAVKLTRSTVTMTGASASLLAADTNRQIVLICNAITNDDVTFDPTGGTCSVDDGVPLAAGEKFLVSGLAAQSAMTQFGPNAQKLTILVGTF